MKICYVCQEKKELIKFVRQGNIFRNKCRDCSNKSRRTGKPRASFLKGNIPWNKNSTKKTRNIELYKEWKKLVNERDGNKCTKCFGVSGAKRLHTHHIIPWKEDEEKRFCVNNGITLCNSCHAKLETENKKGQSFSKETEFKKGQIAWNKGKKFSLESREKMSKAKKGKSWTEKRRKAFDKSLIKGI